MEAINVRIVEEAGASDPHLYVYFLSAANNYY